MDLCFLIPSLGSAMVMSIYTLTDAIVIGKGVGANALAALSITTPLLCILMAMGILFGAGGSVQIISSGSSVFQLYCDFCPGRWRSESGYGGSFAWRGS